MDIEKESSISQWASHPPLNANDTHLENRGKLIYSFFKGFG